MKKSELKLLIKESLTQNPFKGDLLNVGKTKAVGYLPLKTINSYKSPSKEDFIKYAKNNGLGYKEYSEKDSSIGSGSLYIWDNDMVMSILSKYNQILKDAKIPTEDPFEYVDYIVKNLILPETHPEAYEVVGKSFNDSRFK